MVATCPVQGRPQSTHLRSVSAVRAGGSGGGMAGRGMAGPLSWPGMGVWVGPAVCAELPSAAPAWGGIEFHNTYYWRWGNGFSWRCPTADGYGPAVRC